MTIAEDEAVTPSPKALAAAAQLWCLPQFSGREMDVEFANAIALTIDAFAEERVRALPAFDGQFERIVALHDKVAAERDALQENLERHALENSRLTEIIRTLGSDQYAGARAAVVAVLRELHRSTSVVVDYICDDLDRLAGREPGTLLREVRQ